MNISLLAPLNKPMGLAFDPRGFLYVACFGDACVRVYDPSFQEIACLQGEFLKGPHNIFFGPQNEIYVCDYMNGTIAKFTSDFQFSCLLVGVALAGICNAATDSDGNILAVNFQQNTIVKLTPNGEFLGWIGAKRDGSVNEGWNPKLEDSTYSRTLGAFDKPGGISIDSQGRIYVADTANHRVQRFTSDGKISAWLGSPRQLVSAEHFPLSTKIDETQSDMTPGSFSFPLSVRVDSEFLLVAGSGNHRIQAFTIEGNYLGWVGAHIETLTSSNGWKIDGYSMASRNIGGFVQPYDACFHNDDLFVADTYNFRIQLLTGMRQHLKVSSAAVKTEGWHELAS